MTAQKTKGITMPEAPLVWKAVAYAETRLKCAQVNGHPPKPECREDVMIEWITEWLVARGYDDIALIVQFDQEYQALETAVLQRITDVLGRSTQNYFFPWLLLQGRSIFDSLVVTPTLYHLFRQLDSCREAYFADHAMDRFFTDNEEDEYKLLRAFEARLKNGAELEDFRGWDVAKTLTEFGMWQRKEDDDEDQYADETDCPFSDCAIGH